MTEIWKTLRALLVLVVGRGILEDKQSYKNSSGELDAASRFALADLPSWSPGFFLSAVGCLVEV